MIHERIELHNVAELVPVGDGLLLQRVPEALRPNLNEAARFRVRQPDNAEIRFVAGGEPVRVTVSSLGRTDVTVFHGVFDGRERYTVGRDPLTIRVDAGTQRLAGLETGTHAVTPFASGVRRLILGGRNREPLLLHAVEGEDVRPPEPDEVPRRRYLAYGTSITQGFDCSAPYLSYAGRTAMLLDADLVNLGVGGACQCEAAFADYIARRTDWDVATLELSVNMEGFELQEFRRRVGYMVDTVAGADTRRPVVCMTLFPYYRDLGVEDPRTPSGCRPEAFREALRDAVAACPHPNVQVLEGPALLKDIRGLGADLLHPSDAGMIEIAGRLAASLDALLP